MKIHIVKPGQEPIAGYTSVTASPNGLALDVAADNQCNVILAPDVTDSFHFTVIDQLFKQLITKLRLGGELVVGGTDIRLFSKSVANGVLDHKSASQIVGGVQSMMPCDKIEELLRSMGLEILSTHMDGVHYEVKCRRTK